MCVAKVITSSREGLALGAQKNRERWGEWYIIYLVSEYLKIRESERKEDYLHNPFENIRMGNPTEFSRFSSKLRVIERGFGI
jgi:hypothetical protein